MDTNVLINLSKYDPFYSVLFKSLEEESIIPVIPDVVRFEFLRGAATHSELFKLEKLLNNISPGPSLPVVKETLITAREISNLYQWKLKNNKIGMGDCLLASIMKSYNKEKQHLYLATENHDDFPPVLFERVGIQTIDTKPEIHNIGFYAFKTKEYSNLKKRFNRT